MITIRINIIPLQGRFSSVIDINDVRLAEFDKATEQEAKVHSAQLVYNYLLRNLKK